MPEVIKEDGTRETDIDHLRWEYKKTVIIGAPDADIKKQLDAADMIDTTMRALTYYLDEGDVSGEERSRLLNAADAVRARALSSLKRGNYEAVDTELTALSKMMRILSKDMRARKEQ